MRLHRHFRLATTAAFTLALLAAGAWAAPGRPAGDAPPEGLNAADWNHLRGLMEEAAYEVEPAQADADDSFQAANHKHRMRTVFEPSGIRVLPGDAEPGWELGLQLTGYGYDGALRQPDQAQLVADGARMEYRRGDLVEWYVNDGRGLEQGFTLAARPGPGDGRLRVEMQVSGSLAPRWTEGADSLTFASDDGATRLDYGGLIAWDADGVRLAASLEVENDRIALVVDDAEARYPLNIDPTIVNETAKLTVSDAAELDWLGYSVAVSGDTVVAGASSHDCSAGFRCGAVYVFEKPAGGWTDLTDAALLKASDGASYDSLGSSVAVAGDTVVAGAPRNGASDSGSVYVFERPIGGWTNATETAKLRASDGAEWTYTGQSVAISGNTVAAGSPEHACSAGLRCGVVYVFEKPAAGWTDATETALLKASDGAYSDELGSSVAVAGDVVVAGAPDVSCVGNSDHCGAVYVFEKPAEGWSNTLETAKLTASDGQLSELGASVAISGDTVAAGAPRHACSDGNSCGVVYVFEKPGGGWTNVNEAALLKASDGTSGAWLGHSVGISGDTVVAVAPKSDPVAYVFEKAPGGWTNATEDAQLVASDRGVFEAFIFRTYLRRMSVAIAGRTAVMGVPGHDCPDGNIESNCGAAYVFELDTDPEITTSGVTVEQGASATSQLIATVADVQDPSMDLEVTVESDNPANDVTLSQIYVASDGAVTADIAAGCLASDADFTLRVADTGGRTGDGLLEVTVTPETTAPEASVGVGLTSLWPNDKSFLNVGLSGGATDNCDEAPDVQVAVYSNEDDEFADPGEDVHSPDAAAVGDSLVLRAERQDSGQGRVYLIVVTATDAAGNQDVAATTVVVPKNNSPQWSGGAAALADAAEAYALANDGAPPPGYALVGDGPVIGPKQP